MDIGFTEEQEVLRTSARRFLENECPTAFVRHHGGGGGDDRPFLAEARRKRLARHSLPEVGGSGLGLVDMTVLME